MATNPYNIRVGQVWRAASGEPFGYVITAEPDAREEVTARAFSPSGLEAADRSIDAFKLTYRYALVLDLTRNPNSKPEPPC